MAHLMPRNPERGLVYWDVEADGGEARGEDGAILVGRLARLEADAPDDAERSPVGPYVEFELGTERGRRFVDFHSPGAPHRFWVGLRAADGSFSEIAASDVVWAPRRQPGGRPVEFVDFDVEAGCSEPSDFEGPEGRLRRLSRERRPGRLPSSHDSARRPTSGEH